MSKQLIKLSDNAAEKIKEIISSTNKETLGVRVWPNPVWFETYQEEVDQLKGWITDRMNWLNTKL